MVYKVNQEECSACGLCPDVCPVGAISQVGPYVIDKESCTECGLCAESCPSGAIDCLSTKSGTDCTQNC
ncbi:MAG: 4Fe-4S binding protein [Deltaproteobacteria bacterium]|nr:4Fe-4S binding protein [Deltaproteobacteria bacterium]